MPDQQESAERVRADRPGESRPGEHDLDVRPQSRPAPPPGRDESDVSDAGDRKGGDKDGEGRGKRRNSRLPLIILAIATAIAAIGGTYYWYMTRNQESTDDAYTDGNVVMIAPHVSGYVTSLLVNDNQHVNKGDVMLQIDPRDFEAAREQSEGNLRVAEGQARGARINFMTSKVIYPARLDAAKAQLVQAQANLFNAQTEYSRQHKISREATTQQAVDQSTANQRTAEAQVQNAQAQVAQANIVAQLIEQAQAQVDQLTGQEIQAKGQLDQANLNLGWTKVVAPQEGWVTRRNVNQGNYIQSGQQIMSLVTPDIWVTANFKETQLDRIKVGQKVDIEIDAYPDFKLHGHVNSIQLGSGAQFSTFPAENATGNFVKIVRRVPVKITLDGPFPPGFALPLGISVVPTVYVK